MVLLYRPDTSTLPSKQSPNCRRNVDPMTGELDPPANLLMPRVRVEGLTSETGQALNGKLGYRGRHHADAGRYEVFVDGRAEGVKIKPANLVDIAES